MGEIDGNDEGAGLGIPDGSREGRTDGSVDGGTEGSELTEGDAEGSQPLPQSSSCQPCFLLSYGVLQGLLQPS